jgi:F0F1-type ATP synthase membrane subunit a
MALTGLETMVAVLQSGVFGLLSSFYLTEVLSKRDSL